ncbi:MAG: CvpA family protein [Bryobacterales bacterium]|nr:CvpA family protein [Bryobacterales bacterium]
MNEIASRLNWLDFLLLFILATSLIASLARGFTREIAGLVALLLGILLGMWFHGAVGSVFLPYVSAPQIADFLGFGVIFFAITAVGAVAGFLIAKVLRVAGLSLFDRLLGGAFGLLKGALFGAIIIFAMLAFAPKGPPESVSRSVVAPYITWTTDLLAAIAPRELRDAVERNMTAMRGMWEKAPAVIRQLPGTETPAAPPPTASPKPAPAQSPAGKPSPNKARLHSRGIRQIEGSC